MPTARKRAELRLKPPGFLKFSFPMSILGYSSGSFHLEIPSGGMLAVAPGTRLERHKHLFGELHYIRRGEMTSTVGRRKIGLEEGSLLFVNAGDSHEHQAVRHCEAWYFALMITKYQQDSAADTSADQDSNPVLALLSAPSRAIRTTESLRRNLADILEARDSLSAKRQAELHATFGEFLHGLSEALSSERTDGRGVSCSAAQHVSKPAQRTVVAALKRIEKDYASPLSVGDIARHVSTSQRQLERVVKGATGSTLTQHLMEARLRNALKLLSTTELKIDAVMDLSGFRSRGHFYRYFAERTGASPESFRRNSAELALGGLI